MENLLVNELTAIAIFSLYRISKSDRRKNDKKLVRILNPGIGEKEL
jgi:hypothetical protein